MDVSKAIEIDDGFFGMLKTAMTVKGAQICPPAFVNIQAKFIFRVDSKTLDGSLTLASSLSLAKQIIFIPSDFGRCFVAAVACRFALLLLFPFRRIEDGIDFFTCCRQRCPAAVLG